MSLTKIFHHDVYDFIDPRTTLKGAAAGKSVLVTGGGIGIGRGIAQQFAVAGATTIFIVARTLSQLEEAAASVKAINPEIRAITFPADVANADHITALFATIKKELNGSSVDICVSNAGISGEVASIGDSKIDEWWNCLEVNLKGVYLVGREFIRSAKEAGKGGVLINTSSVGSYWTLPGLGAYQISKAAVNRFSEFVHAEHKNDGIRSYAFHPGGVHTAWWKHFDDISPDIAASMANDTPELPGAFCVYIATERAAWLSGKYLSANWDMKEVEEMRERIEKEGLLIQKINGSNVEAGGI